jgi:hypothetical protein
MLLSLLFIIYGLILCFCLGNYSWTILQKWFGLTNSIALHQAIFPIIGMAAMSPVIGLYHFFFKIDFVLHVFFLGVVFLTYQTTWFKAGLSEIKRNWIVYTILIIGAVFSIMIRPGTGDIADYHLQAIKWAENYPNIIGLGNFNRPLANNNWWFNLQAFFGFSWLGVNSVYVGNALFFIAVFAWLYLSETISTAHAWMRFIFASFVILSLKTAFIGAVTSDFIVTLMIYLLLDLSVLGLNRKENGKEYLLLMVLFICWIVTVKTTAIVFFMLPLLGLTQLFIKKQYSFLTRCVVLGLVFIIPWLIGNVIICGYLLYPFNQLDFFAVDWKVPASFFEYDKIVLNSWAKVPNQDVYVTKMMPISDWLPMWFARLDILNKLLVIGFIVSAPLSWIFLWKKKDVVWPVLFVQLGFVLIFVNGPHPRFLFGYMVSSIAFFAYLIADYLPINLPKKALLYLGVLLLLFLTYSNRIDQNLTANWFKPKPYPQVNLEPININGFEAMIAKENGVCWDQFPSSYYFIERVELRGTTVESGFRVKQ